MDIFSVLNEIVTSSVIILGVYGLIITTSGDLFERIDPLVIPDAPIPVGSVHKYRGGKAKRLRFLLGRIPWALFVLYISGTFIFICDALKIVDIFPQKNLGLKHFRFGVDLLNYISLLVVMYIVACLVSVRSNPDS